MGLPRQLHPCKGLQHGELGVGVWGSWKVTEAHKAGPVPIVWLKPAPPNSAGGRAKA